jgi:precorrin-6B methylase 2
VRGRLDRALRRARATATALYYERRLGLETRGRIELDELGLDPTNRTYYEPTEWSVLGRVLPKREVGPEDVFCDFGSGMGRVVVLAGMRYRAARVLGVELSEELHRIAERNVERNRERFRARAVEVFCADVLESGVPDDVTIAYVNNSFQGPVFAGWVDHLLASLDRNPRVIRIIYRNPVEAALLERDDRVRRVREWRRGAWRGRPRGAPVYVYRVEAAAKRG